MNTILRPVLELTVMISGLFLAYLPVQTYLKQPPGRLAAWLAPLLAGICLLEGGFCYFLNIPTSSVLFPTLLVLMLIYHKSLTISIWKSGSIFLEVQVFLPQWHLLLWKGCLHRQRPHILPEKCCH